MPEEGDCSGDLWYALDIWDIGLRRILKVALAVVSRWKEIRTQRPRISRHSSEVTASTGGLARHIVSSLEIQAALSSAILVERYIVVKARQTV